ncbi:unnamed protein product, partial [Bubo scandiacus]
MKSKPICKNVSDFSQFQVRISIKKSSFSNYEKKKKKLSDSLRTTEDLPVGITYIGEVSENGKIKERMKKNVEEGNKGVRGRLATVLPLSIINLKPLCPTIERCMILMKRELNKNLEELERRRRQNDASFPSFCIAHTSSCIIVITRPKNKSTLRYLSAYGSPQSWC